MSDNLILQERDTAVNWHPYTQMKTAATIPIVSGRGSYLYDADGKQYIDAISSWWVTLHGHAHPYIAQKVSEQLQTLEQVIFAGFTHPQAIELSERLLALLPEQQEKVFYSDNGSTAVEVAVKMCIQYYANLNIPKSKILAFKNGYHGDTFGAMSISERNTWTAPFREQLFEVIYIEVPDESNMEQVKATIDLHAADVICFIYEPLVQGAGGMLMHEAKHLSALLNHCRAQNILLIQDEIFVGFGRTGTLFAADQLDCAPDLMCFSKGLTGGTMPMGITTASRAIYQAFFSDDKSRSFFHGHSFTANPLACTAALASLDLLLATDTRESIQNICDRHQEFIREFTTDKARVRQCGTILAIEILSEQSSYFNALQPYLYQYFIDRNIIIRPLGNIIYLVPPYCISKADLDYIYATIMELIDKI
ncbi:MAG: adenosylmethionine--8-amino-7-oxononanoate transaminase [Bacteroidetes bacterium 43-16]|nr:MAG: adenosylmethionine--8-amino-7-oxononanoate transaminase [Bacteroidetes bacterium 43-16]